MGGGPGFPYWRKGPDLRRQRPEPIYRKGLLERDGTYFKGELMRLRPLDEISRGFLAPSSAQLFDTEAKDVLLRWTVSGAHTLMVKVRFYP